MHSLLCIIEDVTSLVEDVVEGLEGLEEVLGIFLDLTKAFECEHHKILLIKPEGFGVCGLVLEWIESHLRGKKSVYRLPTHYPLKLTSQMEYRKGPFWVSVLFFLTYVNNVDQSVRDGKVF